MTFSYISEAYIFKILKAALFIIFFTNFKIICQKKDLSGTALFIGKRIASYDLWGADKYLNAIAASGGFTMLGHYIGNSLSKESYLNMPSWKETAPIRRTTATLFRIAFAAIPFFLQNSFSKDEKRQMVAQILGKIFEPSNIGYNVPE